MLTRLHVALPAVALALALAACAGSPSAPAAQPTPEDQPGEGAGLTQTASPTSAAGETGQPPTATTPSASPTGDAGGAADAPSPTAVGQAPAGELTVEEVTVLVRTDLASALGVAAGAINVVSSESRIWPDAGLGCMARRGQVGGPRVPGYLIVLAYADQRYAYHTDRAGAFVRCPQPLKPIDPIR